jgi:hypothetical protein
MRKSLVQPESGCSSMASTAIVSVVPAVPVITQQDLVYLKVKVNDLCCVICGKFKRESSRKITTLKFY